MPASNVAVGSVFNLDFPIIYVLHGNKELTLLAETLGDCSDISVFVVVVENIASKALFAEVIKN